MRGAHMCNRDSGLIRGHPSRVREELSANEGSCAIYSQNKNPDYKQRNCSLSPFRIHSNSCTTLCYSKMQSVGVMKRTHCPSHVPPRKEKTSVCRPRPCGNHGPAFPRTLSPSFEIHEKCSRVMKRNERPTNVACKQRTCRPLPSCACRGRRRQIPMK